MGVGGLDELLCGKVYKVVAPLARVVGDPAVNWGLCRLSCLVCHVVGCVCVWFCSFQQGRFFAMGGMGGCVGREHRYACTEG